MRFMLFCLFVFCSAGSEAASARAAKLEGCWVRFFGDEEFKRPIARVVGALFLNSVFGPGYIDAVAVRDFPRRVRSLAVGPEAKVFVYAEPGFKTEVAALGPDDKVSDLASIGFPKAVGSLKILCAR